MKRGKARVEMSQKILILSDRVDVRRHLKRLIDSQPAWKAAGEKAGDKALAGRPLKRPPDVVIAEISRIDASLLPMLTAIRKRFSDSKILAVSSHRDSRLILRIIHAGVNGYLIMDRASEELAGAIKTIIAGQLYLSPGIAGLAGNVSHDPKKGT